MAVVVDVVDELVVMVVITQAECFLFFFFVQSIGGVSSSQAFPMMSVMPLLCLARSSLHRCCSVTAEVQHTRECETQNGHRQCNAGQDV